MEKRVLKKPYRNENKKIYFVDETCVNANQKCEVIILSLPQDGHFEMDFQDD